MSSDTSKTKSLWQKSDALRLVELRGSRAFRADSKWLRHQRRALLSSVGPRLRAAQTEVPRTCTPKARFVSARQRKSAHRQEDQGKV